MRKLLILLIPFAVLSCNPAKYISKHITDYPGLFPPDTFRIAEVEKVRDSITKISPDSAVIEALFECDSNNNVLIKNIEELSTKGVNTKIIFKDNRFAVKVLTDSLDVMNKLFEKYKAKEVIKINPVNKKYENDNKELKRKLKVRNYVVYYAIIITIVFLAFIRLKKLKI